MNHGRPCVGPRECGAHGRIELLDEEYERLGTVTADDVREVARRYLLPESVSGVAYLPDGVGDDLTAERLAASFAVAPLTTLAPPDVTPPAPRAPRAALGSRTAEVLHVPLGGLDILIRRKPGVPLVNLGYYVPRDASEAPGMAGVGALAMRSIIRGAGSLDGAALAFAAEGLGGTLSASAGIDWSGLSLPVLSENLAAAANLLRIAAFEPAFHELDVLTERGLLLEEARQLADDMFRYPFLLAFGAAFRDQGYGRPVGGTVETLPTLGIDDVRAWHRTSFAGRRGALVVVGDLDPDAAVAELAGVFGDVPGNAVAPPRARQLVRPDPNDWQRVTPRAKAQTAFAMAFPAPTGATRSGTPPTCGVRSRAGWAAACSTHCATAARWRTRWSERRGPGVMAVPSSRTSLRHPNGRRKLGRRC